MAVQYYVNIKVSIGASFNQEFYLTNPDRSPMDLTGCKVCGNIAKHAASIDAVNSTSTVVKHKFVPFSGTYYRHRRRRFKLWAALSFGLAGTDSTALRRLESPVTSVDKLQRLR